MNSNDHQTDHDVAQIIWDYMKFEQPLEKADCIIGLGNLDIRTAEWSADQHRTKFIQPTALAKPCQ